MPLPNEFIEGLRTDLGREGLGTLLLGLGEEIRFHRGGDVLNHGRGEPLI
jgi:hypothetical protein